MGFWAIVPIKPLRSGKSRLSGVLSDEERASLNLSMLQNTLNVLVSVKEIEEIFVVSRDSTALAIARELDCKTVQEDGKPGLNIALKRATMVVRAYSKKGVVILPADLPLLKQADLENFLKLAGDPPSIVIAPDRRNEGTNALLIQPAGLINYEFGPGSFKKHLEAGEKANAHIQVCYLENMALDLDLPEDLEYLRNMEVSLVKK
ncbi:MAG: 2-phospho-L-lactate guanylyltransferase [Anaerolineaceae bacterium]